MRTDPLLCPLAGQALPLPTLWRPCQALPDPTATGFGGGGDRKDKPRGPQDSRTASMPSLWGVSGDERRHACTHVHMLPPTQSSHPGAPRQRPFVSLVPLKSEPRDKILCLTVNLKLQAGSLPQRLEIPLLLVVTGTGKKFPPHLQEIPPASSARRGHRRSLAQPPEREGPQGRGRAPRQPAIHACACKYCTPLPLKVRKTFLRQTIASEMAITQGLAAPYSLQDHPALCPRP